jgi:uncharacterized membrane protein YgaE (UPF0421/DUF939 family)
MTENPGNLKSQRPQHILARAIGCFLGAAIGYAVYKLIGFENFWLWMLLVVGCIFLGSFLAQKIASK